MPTKTIVRSRQSSKNKKGSKFSRAFRKISSSKPLTALTVMVLFGAIGGAYILYSKAASPSTRPITGFAATGSTDFKSYRYVAADGGVFAYGSAPYLGGGNAGAKTNFTYSLNEYAVGMAAGRSNDTYFILTNKGRVVASTNSPHYGDMITAKADTNRADLGQAVGIAATQTGKGYWIVTKLGVVFSFGDANVPTFGLPSIKVQASNIVAIAGTGTDKGFWLLGSDGGVFSFGDAKFFGSLPGSNIKPAAPIVSMVRARSNLGYYILGRDGGVFTFGTTATFRGSAYGKTNTAVAIDITQDSGGYWIAAQDGGVFTYGNAGFSGNTAASYAPNSCSTIDPNTKGTYDPTKPSGGCVPKTCAADGPSGKTQGNWGSCTAPPVVTKVQVGSTTVAVSGPTVSQAKKQETCDKLIIAVNDVRAKYRDTIDLDGKVSNAFTYRGNGGTIRRAHLPAINAPYGAYRAYEGTDNLLPPKITFVSANNQLKATSCDANSIPSDIAGYKSLMGARIQSLKLLNAAQVGYAKAVADYASDIYKNFK